MTTSGIFRGAGSSWANNQLVSSAQMLERIITDDLARGFTHNALEHAREIEDLLRPEVLPTESAVRLLLLGAMELDAASSAAGDEYGRKCLLFVSRMRTLCQSLQQAAVRVEAERFAVRVQLNLGDVARAEVWASKIERRYAIISGGAGQTQIELPDGDDDSGVSVATWLLLAEVSLSRGDYEAAQFAMHRARERWGESGRGADDSALFELLAALLAVGRGDDQGACALAFIYSKYCVERGSAVSVPMRSRIAAAAGFVEECEGIGVLEIKRLRALGPEDLSVIETYLSGGAGGMTRGTPCELPGQEEMLGAVSSLGAEPGEVVTARRDGGRFSFGVGGGAGATASGLPLMFDLVEYQLDSVTAVFDECRKTGPLVIDWSGCAREQVEAAVSSGAVGEFALRVTRGVIFFNEGAYVDAALDTFEPELMGLSPREVIVELHRFGMARIPGARGCHAESGPGAARDPEKINLRPGRYNYEVFRRVDIIRARNRGEVVEDEPADDEAFERGIAAMGESTAATAAAVVPDAMPAEALEAMSGIFTAPTLTELCQAVCVVLLRLGAGEASVVVVGEDEKTPLGAAGSRRVEGMTWGTVDVDPLTLKFGVASGSVEGVMRVVVQAAAQRIRLMPGSFAKSRPVAESGYIAVDGATVDMLEQVRVFAGMDGTTDEKQRAMRHILVTGERGTGKEEIARLIHRWSGRAGGPFLAIDAGTFGSWDLLAAELFGSKKGSYTGANADRGGLVRAAEGGTLFIDEIDESGFVQTMLKRFAQFGTYRAVGSDAESVADVRLVLATNQIGEGGALIKEDLRDRFWEVRIQPLRERRGDIQPLAEYFAREFLGFELPPTVLAFLAQLEWPGNVRQLRSVVERACSLADGDPNNLTLQLFEESVERFGGRVVVRMADDGGGLPPLKEGESLKERLTAIEREYVIRALRVSGNNRTHAARLLGVRRQDLYNVLKRLSVSDEDVKVVQA